MAHDTRLDDIFAATRAKWEADEPGRAERAEAARAQYLKRKALEAQGLPATSVIPVEGAEPPPEDDKRTLIAERVAMLGHAPDEGAAETEAAREQKRAALERWPCVQTPAAAVSVLSKAQLEAPRRRTRRR